MKTKVILLAAASTIALVGCANTGDRSGRLDRSESMVDSGLSRLGGRNALRAGGAQFSEGVFVGASPERHNSSALLPARFQAAGAIRLESRDPMTLPEIAQRLSEITSIPHVMALGPTGNLVSGFGEELRSASDVSSEADTEIEAEAGGRPAPTNGRASASRPASSGGSEVTMRPNLRGSLSDVLNQVTATFEVEWSYSDGRILFRDYVTRKYQITALPSTAQSSSAIGANSISTTSAVNSDVWVEVRDTLQGLIGDQATVAIGSTTGLVTVTAKVSDQNRVEEYIKELNGTLGQQISFDVNVLTVALNDEQSFGLDLGGALAKGSDGAIRIGPDVFDASGTDIGSYNIGLIRGDFSLGAVVNALASQGKVSVATRAGATTSNNRVAPIEVVDQFAYLKEIAIEQDDNGNERILRTPDTVTTGFQMQLFPRVMNNRDIMVQYTVRLSELNDIKTFGDGNEAVQLPEISTTSFEQQAVLENGQTLVLAGFERRRVSSDGKGSVVGLSGFGGSKRTANQRVATVMMITPHIIGRSSASR
ncbi:hypothetical protein [Defluviimonas salinarum]|uniref:Type II/III secretion system secretin-like domain-containing protein n=1 Tax=Defluviimonas salinarum TaxID=2992147 RepID=A0ABT3J4F1_9RHOB|nr:hypothetical protein [Defluviimonas salinarum]MCW3782570.1 hypothetical protein [Defluviimonas salinarum]